MNGTEERLAGWIAVLLFTFGSLAVFLRLREWYQKRGRPDPLKLADGEKYPLLKLDLRRWK